VEEIKLAAAIIDILKTGEKGKQSCEILQGVTIIIGQSKSADASTATN